MNSERYIKLGRWTALLSFLFGTMIFGLYFLTSASNLLFVGYIFIVAAGLINIGVFVAILIKSLKEVEYRKRLRLTCGLMLLNIPMMLFYCWVSMILLNTMRITFHNSTERELTNIDIIGCETKHIDKLQSGESKTVWVGITGDCSINVAYSVGSKREEKSVVGYVTNDFGKWIRYNIGGVNDDGF